MGALADIRARMGKLKRPPRGAGRAILVGVSAQRSICTEPEYPELPDEIGGLIVLTTNEFDGWAIRDCLKSGRWVEAELVVKG